MNLNCAGSVIIPKKEIKKIMNSVLIAELTVLMKLITVNQEFLRSVNFHKQRPLRLIHQKMN